MHEIQTEADFIRSFQQRMAALRKARGWSQEQMALALGVPLDRYKKYEKREKSTLPLYLLEAFCDAVGQDIAFVVTGRTGVKSFRAKAGDQKANG